MPKSQKIIFFFAILAVILGLANYIATTPAVKDKFRYQMASPFGEKNSILEKLLNSSSGKNKTRVVYGFLPYWTIEQAKYQRLDTLTDIAYFGIYLNADGTLHKVDDNGETNAGYNNWRNNKDLDDLIAKSKQNGVRFALTIISHEDDKSTKFLKCQTCWATLKDNLIKELDYKGIKDVHLNFEYVGYVEDPELKTDFTNFTSYLNKELDKKYVNSFLVVSSFADANTHDRITDIPSISKAADAIFIMGYDFHRPTSDTAGPVAPMGGIGDKSSYDINTMVKDYIAAAPPSKLILGVPYYGYNWVIEKDEPYAKRIKNADEIDDEEPATQPNVQTDTSAPTPVPEKTTDEHSVSQMYDVVMRTIDEVKPEVKWDDIGKVPYFTYTSPDTKVLREVYFENAESLKYKYDLVKQNNFLGVGIWALGYDGDRPELWNLLKFVQR